MVMPTTVSSFSITRLSFPNGQGFVSNCSPLPPVVRHYLAAAVGFGRARYTSLLTSMNSLKSCEVPVR